jgi:4-hydroxy-tetrahydrodipicolinate reductase
VVRGGDVAGEHTVYLFGEGERLELSHRSQSADIFARGALLACRRIHGIARGRYTMQTLPLLPR